MNALWLGGCGEREGLGWACLCMRACANASQLLYSEGGGGRSYPNADHNASLIALFSALSLAQPRNGRIYVARSVRSGMRHARKR